MGGVQATLNTTYNIVNDGTFSQKCTNALFYVGIPNSSTIIGQGYIVDGVLTISYNHPSYPLTITYTNGTLSIARGSFGYEYSYLYIMYY